MPSTATDILDGISTSTAVKAPCKVASTTPLTLSGEQTVSGVPVVEDDRVLVNGQADAVQNGIYTVKTGAWERAKDFDGRRDARDGTLVFVVSSATYYRLTTDDVVVIGTSEIHWLEMTLSSTGMSSYATLTALRSFLDPATNQQVRVGGHTAINDGGGGHFYWDATASEDDDNGYVVLPSGHVGDGRFRRVNITDTVDIRQFGAEDSRSTAVNSAAFSAAVLYWQAVFPRYGKIRASGALTFDPTLFPYVDEFGLVKIIMAVDIASGVTDRLKVPVLELGGQITFTTPFYVPTQWTVKGVGGYGAVQFSTGMECQIIGDVVCRGYGPKLQDLAIYGQLFLDGHTPGSGQDALVYLDNVSVTLSGARATNGEAALRLRNKYWIWANRCVFASIGTTFTDPTTSIAIVSNFETGLMRFEKCIATLGSIDIDISGGGTNFQFYFNVQSESLTRSALFRITGGAAPASGVLDLDQCVLADNQVSGATMVDMLAASWNGIKMRGCIPSTVANMNRVKYLDITPGIFFEYSTVDINLTNWRPTQRIQSGNNDTVSPIWLGQGISPGYVKPTFKPLANTIPVAFTPVIGGALDGVGTAYTKSVSANEQPGILVFSPTTPSMVSGDVMLVSFWAKRINQTDSAPMLNVNLTKTSDGTTQLVDAFSGSATPQGNSPAGRISGYTWYYTWLAFKAQVTGTNYVSAYLTSIPNAGTLTIADVSTILVTGDLTYLECYQLAMANMRFPSLIAAGTPPTEYYSWAPGAYHALRADVAIGSSVAKVVDILPGNVFLPGKGATGSRPSGALPQGSLWVDTTLGKLIMADGASGWTNPDGSAL